MSLFDPEDESTQLELEPKDPDVSFVEALPKPIPPNVLGLLATFELRKGTGSS